MVIGVLIGLAVGLLIGLGWHLARGARTSSEAHLAEARLADAKVTVTEQSAQLQALAESAAAAERGRAVAQAELDLLRRHQVEAAARAEEDTTRLMGAFAALSAEALAKNNEQFLALADTRFGEVRTAAQGDLARRQQAIEEMLAPLSETLTRYERGIQLMETERKGAYEGLSERVAALHLGHEQLQKETRNLVTALRSPHTRGRWGEMTLRRAVEAAGMLEHCDFEEQKTVAGDDGYLRPDMIVQLPGGGQVVIDSKVPLEAFLQFIEADDDDARQVLLEKHAKQLRTHIDQLAKKEYWKQFDRSPEFVVAFIPGEPLLAAALDADPALQEHALDKRIILATPNTLVAALRTIALSWQQETLAENAREVRDLGAELYERLRTWTGHMQSLQKSLSASVDAYNRAVGSLETRVLVTARKFPSLGVVGSERAEITELPPIESTPRHLQAVEADDDEGEGAQQNIWPLPDGSASGPRPERLPG
ncbi:MAG TPA: DNA recombination protein RmuC [Acidimicrobiales bacterium]|jgi:DNA recombination protein RmuC